MKRILFCLCVILPSSVLAQGVNITSFVSATPTVDTSAYATGDLIGGKLTLFPACRDTVGTAYVVSVMITDKSAQASDLDLVLFYQNPTGTTFTDQAAFDPSDADLAKIVATVSLVAASRVSFSDNGVKYIGSLTIPIRCADSSGFPGETIYAAIVSRGTPTFAAASDLTVTLGISKD